MLECVKRVMDDHIVPFAKRSDAEVFRKKLGTAEVRGVFLRHGDRLKLLFDRYSKADDSDMHEERAAETMNMKEFMKLMKDKKLLDSRLPHKMVHQLSKMFRMTTQLSKRMMMIWMQKWTMMNLWNL